MGLELGLGLSSAPLPSPGIPFSPDQLSNLVGWYKADEGITKDGGDRVSGWDDQSGQGNDFVQLTGSEQPLFVDSVVNGLPVIRFDETDLVETVSDILSGAVDRTVLMVIKPSSIDSNDSIILIGDSQLTGESFQITPEAAVRVGGGNRVFDTAVSTVSFENLRIHSTNGNTNGLTAYINGVQLGVTSTTVRALDTKGNLGSGIGGRPTGGLLLYDGDIAEIIIYDSDKTSDGDDLDAYLASRYNL